jgi:hypothetical protein
MKTQKRLILFCTEKKNYLNLLGFSKVVGERTLLGDKLDVTAIRSELTSGTSLNIVSTSKRSETPLLGDDDLLLTWELVLTASQSLNNNSLVGILGTDGENDLTNVDTGNETIGLTESTTHTGLQSIGTSTGQHFVDTGDVIRVDTDTHVEGILTRGLGNVLVTTDTTGFKSFSRELFVLVGDQVDTEREIVDGCLLTT